MDLQDAETQGVIARWAGVGVSAIIAVLGLQKWWAKRQQRIKDELDARFDAKANMKELAEAQERITRHKANNDAQAKKHYDAIIDLYGKHEATQSKLLEAEQRSSDRFEALMTALNRR